MLIGKKPGSDLAQDCFIPNQAVTGDYSKGYREQGYIHHSPV
jgi:hypothetical protein